MRIEIKNRNGAVSVFMGEESYPFKPERGMKLRLPGLEGPVEISSALFDLKDGDFKVDLTTTEFLSDADALSPLELVDPDSE